MMSDRNKILLDSVRRLLRRNAVSHLKKIMNKTHAADISIIFRSLPLTDCRRLFNMIDDVEKKGVLFSELDENTLLYLIDGADLEDIVEIFENMPTDDVADLIARLPDEKSSAILELMKNEGSEEVEDLLKYRDDTAGGIMVPEFIALREDDTAHEAINSLQKEHQDVEMPFYLYVVDEYGKLAGVCSLRQLVLVPPSTPLKNIMSTDVYSVTTDMDQEEVAKLVARYDILAVPVVDENNILVGIVTVDDVIDIFREEATEDILKMVGVGEGFIETQSILRSTRIRVPWLMASFLGGIAAFLVIGHFENSLKEFASLAAFIPVIMGMGGNIGTQSSTIVVRGLATGRLNLRDWTVVTKELAIGLILGLVYGSFIAIVAHLQYSMGSVAVSVGLSVLCSMCVAALIGSLFPMVFARANIDPAVATGPFVTTAIDIVSVYFYFKISTTLLGI